MKNFLLRVACVLFLVAALPGTIMAAQSATGLRTFEPDSFRQIVAGHQGKPFAVMLWSLDCEYCEDSFAALADAARKKGLPVVTIATDRADDPEAARLIVQKLKASGLVADSWAFGSAPAERLRYTIDPKWRGEMPRSYWFDGRGGVTAHSGRITSEQVSRLLPEK